MFRRSLLRSLSLALPALLATPVLATDHFLTLGGGDAPTHNQISLEKNVVYLQRVLDDVGIGQSHHDIFFSDGTDPGRDLQVHASADVPKVNRLLARVLMNNENAVEIEYRDQHIDHVRGPSNRKSLAEWFDQVGAKLPDGDRVLIYFTGHGGNGKTPRNTTLTMWRENSMPVKEFAGLLDKLPAKVSVVIVMVQCHSGGFADVIFKNADFSSKPGNLAERNRCGFFATLPERLAAGCTPDINEENYHEYSSYFWEAISGKTRLGTPVTKPDFDGDGIVSFAEAHAYVKLTSSTIDIPVSTSDNFLRAFSRAPGVTSTEAAAPTTQPARPRQRRENPETPKPPASDPAVPTPAPAPSDRPEPRREALIGTDTSYFKLIAFADPARKAVLDGLSEQLKLGGPERARSARDMAGQFQRQKDDAEAQKRSAFEKYNMARERVAQSIRARWPELVTPFHPKQAEILKTEADAIVKAIETHEAYKELETQHSLIEQLMTRSMDLDRKWVKTQRFLRTLEDVALAANLPKVASPDMQTRYKELLAAEYGSLDAGKHPAN